MLPFPRWLAPGVSAVCSVLLALGASAQANAADDPAKPSAPIPTPAQVSAEPTSFDEVAARLDRGGSFYLYLSTEQWLGGLSQQVARWRDFALAAGLVKSDDDREQMSQAFDLAAALVKKSGIEQISGAGFSSLAIAPGTYRNTAFVHHYPGKETGFLNTLFGSAPHPLTELDLLPADTAVATFGDYDVARFVGALRETVEQSGSAELKQSFANGISQFSLVTGLSLDAFLASLGGSDGVILTLDPKKQIEMPVGGDKKVPIPLPRLAILIEVKDDQIFTRIDQLLGVVPGIVKTDEAELRMRTMAFTPSPHFPLHATVARWDKFLVLATDDQLVRDIVAARKSGQGFKATPGFAAVSAGLPTEGNGFGLVTKSFADTARVLQMEMLARQPGIAPDQAEMMRQLFSAQGSAGGYGVSSHVANGWLSVSIGARSLNQTLVPLMLVPVGIAAGIMVPVMTSVQEKGEAAKSLAQAKQIALACKLYAGDHDGNYPPNLDALLPDYLGSKTVLVSPFAPDEPMGYQYTPGLTDESPPDTVLVEDKFAARKKHRIVVHLDCSGKVLPLAGK